MTERGGQAKYLVALIPSAVLLAGLFAYPLIRLVVVSLSVDDGYGLDNYTRMAGSATYLNVFLITLQISLAVTLVTVVLGYPLAYIAVNGPRVPGRIVLACVLAPFFTSLLVRTFAWMSVLGPNGMLNRALAAFGLGPLDLMYNRTAVVIGMAYALLPYTVFTLYGSMRGIDRTLLRAAQSLGAHPFQAWRTIYLPLCYPGLAGAAVLVFILSLGFFITPRLIGGQDDMMVSTLINWFVDNPGGNQFPSAIAVVLLVVTVLGFVVFNRFIKLHRLFESRS